MKTMPRVKNTCRQCGDVVVGSWRRLLCDECKAENQRIAKEQFFIDNPGYRKMASQKYRDQKAAA